MNSAPAPRKPWIKWVLGAGMVFVIWTQISMGHPILAVIFGIGMAIVITLEILVRRSS